MKTFTKFLLLALITCNLQLLTSNCRAQYRCIPSLDAHGNPGGVMPDYDPWILFYQNYTTIGYYTAPAVYYPVQHIPFTFKFNGKVVDAFKVSNTGVLTFDTLAGPPPATSNAVLPSPGFPDNSVIVGGLSILGDSLAQVARLDDYINYSTPIPSRQLWIVFAYSYPGEWSIVLEENTNNIYLVQCFGNWTTPGLTLGVQVSNTEAYMMPGSPNITAAYPAQMLSDYSIDNYYYTFVYGAIPQYDGTILSSTMPQYLQKNQSPVSYNVDFRNLGTDTIHTLQMNYTVNGGAVVTQSFSGLNIACGASWEAPLTWAIPDTGLYHFDWWATQLNGNADQVDSNDHYTQRVYVADSIPHRRLMLEELKTTNCPSTAYYTEPYDKLVIGRNQDKASSIKYDQTFEFSEYSNRSGFYQCSATPTTFANGSYATSDTGYVGQPTNITQHVIDSMYNLPGLFYVQPSFSINSATGHIAVTFTSVVTFDTTSRLVYHVSLVRDTFTNPRRIPISDEDTFINYSLNLYPRFNGQYIGAPHAGQAFTFTDSVPGLSGRYHVVGFVQDSITREIVQCGESPSLRSCKPPTYIRYVNYCKNDSVKVGTQYYKTPGTHYGTYTDINGCDSTVESIVNLAAPIDTTFTERNDTLFAVKGYSSYNWENCKYLNPYKTTYFDTQFTNGNYFVSITDSNGCVASSGCRYICKYLFNINKVATCLNDSFNFRGTWLTPGTYTDTAYSIGGCDSITQFQVERVDTSIWLRNDTLFVNPAYTQSTWINCNGNFKVSSNPSSFFVAPYNGSFAAIATPGGYAAYCTAQTRCITVNLCKPVTVQQSLSICQGDSVQVFNKWYGQTGNYSNTGLSEYSCDSTVMLSLTVNEINASIYQSNDTLYARGAGTIQWKDCNSGNIMSGDTGHIFIPSLGGSYAAIITNGSCSQTTSCETVISTRVNQLTIDNGQWTIYPNPTNDIVNIVLPKQCNNCVVTLTDITGRTLPVPLSPGEGLGVRLDLSSLAAGIYFVRVSNEDGTMTKKIVKQ